jgi:hypothetical protein
MNDPWSDKIYGQALADIAMLKAQQEMSWETIKGLLAEIATLKSQIAELSR